MKRQRECMNGGRRFHRRFSLIGVILAGFLLWPAGTQGDSGWEDWSGLGGADPNWSYGPNWGDSGGNPLPPTAADLVRFGSKTTDSASVVDGDFTIALLRYLGGGVHTMDVPDGSHLRIIGTPVQVGWAGPDNGAAVTWTGNGSVIVGTPASPEAINVGYNNAAGGTNTSSLTINGVTVDAYVNDLSSGGIAVAANYGEGSTNAQLILGPGSHFNAGTPTAPFSPGLTVGYNNGLAGSATGLLDASNGVANLHIETLLVGDNKSGDPGALGSAAGTLTTGAQTTLTATNAFIARGNNTTGVVNMNGGLFAAHTVSVGSGATFNFNAGRLAVDYFLTDGNAGTLEQKGGTLAPGFSRTETAIAGVSTIYGDYQLDAPGTLEIELFDTGYDQLKVWGSADLAGALDVKLNFEPLVNDQFTIIDIVDDADSVSGQFAGLSELGTLDEMYLGSTYKFQISYSSFAVGNDVVLKMIERIAPITPVTIPAPGAMVLGGIGVGLMNWLRKRRLL